MNPLQFLRKITQKNHSYEKGKNYELGHSLSGRDPYAFYKSNDYENAYPSITRIAQTFMMIEPYTIDKNGKPVSSNILDRLYTPNTEMSAADFREALAVMTAVHNKVHIRVHYKTTRLRADTITGFTFLEGATEMVRDNKWFYHLPNGDTISSDEVITLKSINPYDLSEGFSPTQSARKWITVDDYIATYQAGFFKNGAVPAGQFMITAKTVTEFNDIVDNLQSKHRGAGKNNNVVYAHRPLDQNGKASEAQIEWIPYNTTNKDLSMKELFEQANKKIDSSYGVPASIRGVNDQNSYASVRVDEVIFAKYVVKPIALKIWSKFTHELNRVTGGTGVAIDFDLEIPSIADEEKVKAESRKIDFELINSAITAGFSLDSTIDAFKLPVNYKLLKQGTKPTVIENDKPQVASTEELKDTPEQPIDPNVVKKLAVKQMTPETRQSYEQKVRAVALKQMELQAINALDEVKSKALEPTNEEITKFAGELETVLIPLVYEEGTIQRALGYNLVLEAGLDASGVAQFALTPQQLEEYKEYLKLVGTSYTETNAQAIRQILERSAQQQLTATQTRRAVLDFVKEEWRAQRIAVTEVNKAGAKGSLDAMKNIARETGYVIEKVWTHFGTDAPCEFCARMIGTTVPVSESFVPLNGEVIGTEGGVFVNDFTSIDAGDIHPNGHCGLTYRVRRA